jgi:hypothetical protein
MESRYNRFICVLASIPSLEEVGGLGSEERSEGGAGGGGMKDFGSNRFKQFFTRQSRRDSQGTRKEHSRTQRRRDAIPSRVSRDSPRVRVFDMLRKKYPK